MPDELLTLPVGTYNADAPDDLELVFRSDAAPVVAVNGRRVTVRLCRWNEPRTVTDPPNRRYREVHAAGSIELADDVHVVDRHHGTLIGRADPTSFVDAGDGPTVDLVLAHTAAGDDTLALIDAGVIRSVSMELEPVAETVAGDVVTRTRSRVHGVAFAFRPSHDAPILATRDRTNPNGDTMPTDLELPADVIRRDDLDAAVVNLVPRGDLDALLDDVRRDLAAQPDGTLTGRHPGDRFRSLVDYADTAFDNPADAPMRLLCRALVDQITTNNPGVIPPAWLSTVFGIIDATRPTVTAFGSSGLPPEGMDINWPYYDGDLMTLVGEQVAQKTAITSARVDLKRGNTAIKTYAGGSDISYQLIRRSSPSYRDAYLRIMNAAYALVTNNVAADAAVAAATASAATWDPTSGDLTDLATALFTASQEVKRATGQPASFALAADDVFVAAGGLGVAASTPYGVQNVAGTAAASTLRVNVSGLEVINDPALAAGTLLVSNQLAGEWSEDGPFVVTAEDVEKLGQNVAVWGMGAWATFLPQGIRSIGDGTP